MTPTPPTPETPPQTIPLDTADPGQGATPSWSGQAALVQLQPGTRPLPDYELLRKLGEGGFGQAWLASGPGGFKVALKFVTLGERASAAELKALEAIKDIRHAHLLAVFGVWQREGQLIVAMELADRSLLDRFKEVVDQGHPGIPLAELLGYLRDAARGLDFLNEKGIVHRDVKPHNLFLSGDSIKVADYGLAKVLERSLVSASTKMTPAYSAPEFFNGQASKWSDQYCLAASYCQLRGSQLPFQGSVQQMIAGHLLKEPDLSMLPAAERPVVARALAKDPTQRWPNCKAFVEALTLVCGMPASATPLHGASPTSSLPLQGGAVGVIPQDSPTEKLPLPPPPTSSRQRPWLLIAGVAIVLVLVFAVLVGRGLFGTWPASQAVVSPSATDQGLPTGVNGPPPEKKGPSRKPAFALAPFEAEQASEHQEKWADYLTQKVEIANSIGMKFRLIPPGEFDMGSPPTEDRRFGDELRHRVRLSKAYYLGVTEVTQEQYEKVMNRNPAAFKGARLPVEEITWFDAIEFCNRLSVREGKKPCYRLTLVETSFGSIKNAEVEQFVNGTGYRLPSEAEWEYACRAGTATPFHYGKSLDSTQANFNGSQPYGDRPKGEFRQCTTPAGSFAPNAFGLYDMHGNVYEWCQDWYDDSFYELEAGTIFDPVMVSKRMYRVLRGGAWDHPGANCRAAERFKVAPGSSRNNWGFRVAISVPMKGP